MKTSAQTFTSPRSAKASSFSLRALLTGFVAVLLASASVKAQNVECALLIGPVSWSEYQTADLQPEKTEFDERRYPNYASKHGYPTPPALHSKQKASKLKRPAQNGSLILSLASPLHSNGTNLSSMNASDGAIYTVVSGGKAPYKFEWSNGASEEDVKRLPAGTYTLKVTDKDGNSATASFSITGPEASPYYGSFSNSGGPSNQE